MPSLKTFALLNTVIFALGTLNYTIYTYSPFYVLPLYALKNLLLPHILEYASRHDPLVTKPSFDTFCIRYVIQSTLIDFLTIAALHQFARTAESAIWTYVLFIPISFVYELVFDLFHYATHRAIHQNPRLYVWIHKTHHQSRNVNAFTTLVQSPLDLLITNIIPLCLTTLLIPTSSLFLHIYMYYKTLVEMGGHIGRFSKTPCFPQCVWIPLGINIALFAHDHACHHMYPHTNYSKRFALWDKLFGTYRDIKNIKQYIADAAPTERFESMSSFAGI